MNAYPFLNNKHKPIFTSDLADIVPRVRRERVIDITSSPLVPAASLRAKLEILHRAGELDGGLPIIRHDILVGLIPAPDLEYALDNLDDEGSSMCLMAHVPTIDDDDDGEPHPTDFTPYIDQAPVALDIKSPLDLVYECFVKLGLRYICVLKNGRYAGMVSIYLHRFGKCVVEEYANAHVLGRRHTKRHSSSTCASSRRKRDVCEWTRPRTRRAPVYQIIKIGAGQKPTIWECPAYGDGSGREETDWDLLDDENKVHLQPEHPQHQKKHLIPGTC
jgi:hypothetical protein